MSRKIIVYISTSADGYIARADGGIDWLDRPRPKGSYGMGSFFTSIDTILWGRRALDEAVARMGGSSGGGFGKEIKSYAFSRTPPATSPPGVEYVREPIPEFARRLRSEPGKDIWMMGGGGIIASFLDVREIDELLVHVLPVFIGEGIPLIAPARRTVPLKLLSSKKFPDGVVRQHYAVVNRALRRSPDRPIAETICLAALAPERPSKPVPGWVPEPQRNRLRTGVA